MKNFLNAARLLLLDLASTFFFVGLYLVTHSIVVSFGFGIALGVAQIAFELARKKPIDMMQWISLVLVIGSGTATLLTADPRFVLIKPSIIYALVGAAMLRRGWMNRYLPPVALAIIPDVAVIVGYCWSALMFATAAVNLFVAWSYSAETWTAFMGTFTVVSKIALFLVSYFMMRMIGLRRRRAAAQAQAA
jgi:intracellular septation protein